MRVIVALASRMCMSFAPFHSFSNSLSLEAIGISLLATSVNAFKGRLRKIIFLIFSGALRTMSYIRATVLLSIAGSDKIWLPIFLKTVAGLPNNEAE